MLRIVLGFTTLVVLVLLAGYVVTVYNHLVSLHKRIDQAKQNIDVLLKQRQDELTQLIDAVSSVMQHESALLIELTEAREQAEAAETPTEQAAADQQVRRAMADFEARAEAYPELRSQENMMKLQKRIADLETQIADRREVYNDAVTRYNITITHFPYVIFARLFGFDERELFTATESEKEAVDVSTAFDEAAI